MMNILRDRGVASTYLIDRPHDKRFVGFALLPVPEGTVMHDLAMLGDYTEREVTEIEALQTKVWKDIEKLIYLVSKGHANRQLKKDQE